MHLTEATTELNKLLLEKQPEKITSSWIVKNAPRIYRFIWKNVRTEVGDIDWDRIVGRLDKEFQKRWVGQHSRTKKQWQKMKWHSGKREMNSVLKKYQSKLYVFLSPQNPEDRKIRNEISITLVRLAQKGNLAAKQEILSLLKFTADYWIKSFPRLHSWKGYETELDDQLETCVRRYRFTGSFMTYLFCSLEYRGRGLRYLYSYSLDEEMLLGNKRRIENVVQNLENGGISYFKPF